MFFIYIFTSQWLLQDQENDIQQEFPAYSNLQNILFFRQNLLPWKNTEELGTLMYFKYFLEYA